MASWLANVWTAARQRSVAKDGQCSAKTRSLVKDLQKQLGLRRGSTPSYVASLAGHPAMETLNSRERQVLDIMWAWLRAAWPTPDL